MVQKGFIKFLDNLGFSDKDITQNLKDETFVYLKYLKPGITETAEENDNIGYKNDICIKYGLGLRFGHLGKLIVITFYKKSYYFSMLHDMDKVLIKKVAETKIKAPQYNH
ncbi:MAG TPA: hypothetical protein VJL89_08485 [Thermodesulfovibrionia bacterium]|nr:hypothetical protein [Thermodesulfovibrionia bacterium]